MSNLSDDNPDVIAAADTTVDERSHEEPVLVFDAPTAEEAEVVLATLEAAGITATLESPTIQAVAGAIDSAIDSAGWRHGIFVSASNLEAARAILNAISPTEEELTAEEEADPTTLAEAEARVNRL